MAIRKSLKFAAPYTSATFNNEANLQVGRNGIVTGCAVSTSGSVVTIQPGSFIQQGLTVTFDAALSAVLPTNLTAPYSVVVTTSSSVENAAEVITPTFAQRPEDLSANSVVIADWDGQEWIARPHVQMNDVLSALENQEVQKGLVGASNGFNVTSSGSNLSVSAGTLVDQQGSFVTKTLPASLAKVATNAEHNITQFLRVDEVVYRRPSDDPSRPGKLQYVTGPSYVPDGSITITGQSGEGDSSLVNLVGKMVDIPTLGSSPLFFIQDYGARATLVVADISEGNGTGLGSAIPVATNITGFDAAPNPSGNVDIVYTRGNNLYYQQWSFTAGGARLVAETLLATNTSPAINPKVVTVVTGSTYNLHIVYELVISGAVHKLYYMRAISGGTVTTTPALLVDLSSVVTNPSLAKDDTDNLILLAYENSTTGKVYLREYDASTATALLAPTQLGATLELEDDTFVLSSSSVLSASGATQPVVRRADNKETFVFWRQNKGSGNYGVAVYNSSYISTFGHKAVIQDLVSSGENVSLFDAKLDGLNHAHLIVPHGTDVYKASLNLESAAVYGPSTKLNFTPATYTGVATAFGVTGSLYQAWSIASPGTTNNGTALPVQFIGPGLFPVTSSVAASEFVMLQSDYNSLPTVPAVGDSLTIASAGVDNGTYQFLGVRSYTESATNYVAVSTSATFTSQPSGPTVQFVVQTGVLITVCKTNAGVAPDLRSFEGLHTDVVLAHYCTPSGELINCAEALDARSDLFRLYEYANILQSSGSIDWGTVGANLLSFTAPININILGRSSTCTIAAIPAGISIPSGSVAYVKIPDADVATTLTLNVATISSVALDRNNRNALSLFWNIGGTLYSRFDSTSSQIPYTPAMSTAWPYGTPSNVHEGLDSAGDAARSLLWPLKMVASGTRVIINPSDLTLLDGTIASKVDKQLLVNFPGAQVDFLTGNIYDITGVTVTSTFTPAVITAGHWLWYSVNLNPGLVGTDNRITPVLAIIAGSADNAVEASAPRATFSPEGLPVGEVAVQAASPGPGLNTIVQGQIVQTVVTGGSGGNGNGTGTPISPADGFQWLVAETTFGSGPGTLGSNIDAANTSASYNAAKAIYQLALDKTPTITTGGASYTLSQAPNFTVTPGCIVWVNSLNTWARVATVTSQTTGTLDAAFSTNVTGAAGMISQAVTTADLTVVGDSSHHTRGIDIFSGVGVPQVHIDYRDSLTAGDTAFDPVVAADIIVSGSNYGTQGLTGSPLSNTYTQTFTRPSAPNVWPNYPLTSVSGQDFRCFLTFFPNPNNGSVTTQANLLGYQCSMYAMAASNNGGVLNSAFVMSDGSGTPVNASVGTAVVWTTLGTLTSGSNVITVTSASGIAVGQLITNVNIPANTTVTGVAGSTITISNNATASGVNAILNFSVTQVTLNWNYVPTISAGAPNGDITVLIEGQEIPRFFTGVIGQYWTEVDPYRYNLSSYLGLGSYSIHTKRLQGSIDSSSQNTFKLGTLATATVGTSAQVTAGQATFTTLQAALNAVGPGARVIILPGVTTSEPGGTVTINQNVLIMGNGMTSVIGGNVVVSAITGASTVVDGSVFKWFKATGNITLNANYCFYNEAWQVKTQLFTDNGTGNQYEITTV